MQHRGASTLARSLVSVRRLSLLTGHLRGDLADSGTVHFSVERVGDCGSSGTRHALLGVGTAAVASAVGASVLSFTEEGSRGHCEAAGPPPALNPKEFVPFKLKHVERLNHNTKVYRFELKPGQKLGLSVASCLITKAPIGPPNEEGIPKPVIRPYTPITQPDVEGYFDLMVKVYPTGTMSKHIDSLKPGDTLEIKGPIPKLPYAPNMKKQIGMVAGGTGITPMLQVIDAVLRNPEDKTLISLVFANTSPSDVVLKQQLEDYAARHPNFKVYFVVDKANPAKDRWKGGIGFVTGDMLKKALPPPGDDSLILVCGPPGMMKHVSGDKAKDKTQGELEGLLKSLGYTKDQVYKF